MTRDQIAEDLMTLVVRIGNELPPLDDSTLPADIRAAEWAYIKGLASAEILRLRDRLVGLAAPQSLSELAENSGPSVRR